MRLPTEQIYQALFDKVCSINSAATPLVTMSRRWQSWDKIGDIPMPAFFQMQPPEGIHVSQASHFGLRTYKLHASLWFYFAVDSGNLKNPTSPRLNKYFEAIDDLFGPELRSPGGARQQLGLGPGIEHCWIDGTVIFDEGLAQPPAIIMFPITILCG